MTIDQDVGLEYPIKLPAGPTGISIRRTAKPRTGLDEVGSASKLSDSAGAQAPDPIEER